MPPSQAGHICCCSIGQDPEQANTLFLRTQEASTKDIKTTKQVTVRGFETLGLVSTFLASVEATCISLTGATDVHEPAIQAINALLIASLLLSSFGAVTSLLAARWFDLLVGDEELKLLSYRWDKARPHVYGDSFAEAFIFRGLSNNESPPRNEMPLQVEIEQCRLPIKNRIIAHAMFIPLLLIALGFFSFVAGITVYTWRFQSHPTAIVCTLITTVGVGLIICMHLDFETADALSHMKFTRLRL